MVEGRRREAGEAMSAWNGGVKLTLLSLCELSSGSGGAEIIAVQLRKRVGL